MLVQSNFLSCFLKSSLKLWKPKRHFKNPNMPPGLKRSVMAFGVRADRPHCFERAVELTGAELASSAQSVCLYIKFSFIKGFLEAVDPQGKDCRCALFPSLLALCKRAWHKPWIWEGRLQFNQLPRSWKLDRPHINWSVWYHFHPTQYTLLHRQTPAIIKLQSSLPNDLHISLQFPHISSYSVTLSSGGMHQDFGLLNLTSSQWAFPLEIWKVLWCPISSHKVRVWQNEENGNRLSGWGLCDSKLFVHWDFFPCTEWSNDCILQWQSLWWIAVEILHIHINNLMQAIVTCEPGDADMNIEFLLAGIHRSMKRDRKELLETTLKRIQINAMPKG